MGARKVTGIVDDEGWDEIKAYQAKHGVTAEEATTVALNMGAGRMGSLRRYDEKKKKSKPQGRTKAAKEPKAAKPKAAAAAKSKPKASAKPKVAAKAAAKASGKPKVAAKKEAANGDKPKRSPLVAAAKKVGGVSRIAPQKPGAAAANGSGLPVTTEAVAEA